MKFYLILFVGAACLIAPAASITILGPNCTWVLTPGPPCQEHCAPSCRPLNCTVGCVNGTCTDKAECKANCTGATYDGSTCPGCGRNCENLRCPDSCITPTITCQPLNCSWTCAIPRGTFCAPPNITQVCAPTACPASGSTLSKAFALLLSLALY
jgi:hypothetical protein